MNDSDNQWQKNFIKLQKIFIDTYLSYFDNRSWLNFEIEMKNVTTLTHVHVQYYSIPSFSTLCHILLLL